MSLDSREFYRFLREAYKAGLMQKWFAIVNEANQSASPQSRAPLYQGIDGMDQADPSAADAALGRLGPWLKWLSRPLVMRSLSRLLDLSFVRKKIIAKIAAGNSEGITGLTEGS